MHPETAPINLVTARRHPERLTQDEAHYANTMRYWEAYPDAPTRNTTPTRKPQRLAGGILVALALTFAIVVLMVGMAIGGY
jgi:hypothetical protein